MYSFPLFSTLLLSVLSRILFVLKPCSMALCLVLFMLGLCFHALYLSQNRPPPPPPPPFCWLTFLFSLSRVPVLAVANNILGQGLENFGNSLLFLRRCSRFVFLSKVFSRMCFCSFIFFLKDNERLIVPAKWQPFPLYPQLCKHSFLIYFSVIFS